MLKISAIIAAATLAVAALPSVTFAQMENGAMSSHSMSMSRGSRGGALHGMANRMKTKKMHRGMMKKPMRSGM